MINKELQKRILSSIILIPAFFFIKGSIFYILFFIFFTTIYEWIQMCKKNT